MVCTLYLDFDATSALSLEARLIEKVSKKEVELE